MPQSSKFSPSRVFVLSALIISISAQDAPESGNDTQVRNTPDAVQGDRQDKEGGLQSIQEVLHVFSPTYQAPGSWNKPPPPPPPPQQLSRPYPCKRIGAKRLKELLFRVCTPTGLHDLLPTGLNGRKAVCTQGYTYSRLECGACTSDTLSPDDDMSCSTRGCGCIRLVTPKMIEEPVLRQHTFCVPWQEARYIVADFGGPPHFAEYCSTNRYLLPAGTT